MTRTVFQDCVRICFRLRYSTAAPSHGDVSAAEADGGDSPEVTSSQSQPGGNPDADAASCDERSAEDPRGENRGTAGSGQDFVPVVLVHDGIAVVHEASATEDPTPTQSHKDARKDQTGETQKTSGKSGQDLNRKSSKRKSPSGAKDEYDFEAEDDQVKKAPKPKSKKSLQEAFEQIASPQNSDDRESEELRGENNPAPQEPEPGPDEHASAEEVESPEEAEAEPPAEEAEAPTAKAAENAEDDSDAGVFLSLSRRSIGPSARSSQLLQSDSEDEEFEMVDSPEPKRKSLIGQRNRKPLKPQQEAKKGNKFDFTESEGSTGKSVANRKGKNSKSASQQRKGNNVQDEIEEAEKDTSAAVKVGKTKKLQDKRKQLVLSVAKQTDTDKSEVDKQSEDDNEVPRKKRAAKTKKRKESERTVSNAAEDADEIEVILNDKRSKAEKGNTLDDRSRKTAASKSNKPQGKRSAGHHTTEENDGDDEEDSDEGEESADPDDMPQKPKSERKGSGKTVRRKRKRLNMLRRGGANRKKQESKAGGTSAQQKGPTKADGNPPKQKRSASANGKRTRAEPLSTEDDDIDHGEVETEDLSQTSGGERASPRRSSPVGKGAGRKRRGKLPVPDSRGGNKKKPQLETGKSATKKSGPGNSSHGTSRDRQDAPTASEGADSDPEEKRRPPTGSRVLRRRRKSARLTMPRGKGSNPRSIARRNETTSDAAATPGGATAGTEDAETPQEKLPIPSLGSSSKPVIRRSRSSLTVVSRRQGETVTPVRTAAVSRKSVTMPGRDAAKSPQPSTSAGVDATASAAATQRGQNERVRLFVLPEVCTVASWRFSSSCSRGRWNGTRAVSFLFQVRKRSTGTRTCWKTSRRSSKATSLTVSRKPNSTSLPLLRILGGQTHHTN